MTHALPTEVTEDRATQRGFVIAHAAVIALSAIGYSFLEEVSPVVVTLAAGTVVWAMVVTRWGVTEELGPALAAWVVPAALWAGMVAVDLFFLQALFTMYPLTFALIPVPVSFGLAVVPTAIWAISIARIGGETMEWLVFPLVTWVLGCAFAMWVTRVVEQSERRQELLDELARTRAELATAERIAGERQERERLAREIHDTLAQGFTSILLHARAARSGSDPLPTLELIERTASENLVEARRLVAQGAARDLGSTSLVEALERVAGSHALPVVTLTVDGRIDDVGGTAAVALLRVAQEAVANARRHARASAIGISLARIGPRVVLDVSDDGCGFDPAEVRPSDVGGHGLLGLAARLEELGGELDVDAAVGRGTVVSAVIEVGG